MHDDVGVGHGPDGSVGHVEVHRLAHQVAAEELAGGDATTLEVRNSEYPSVEPSEVVSRVITCDDLSELE